MLPCETLLECVLWRTVGVVRTNAECRAQRNFGECVCRESFRLSEFPPPSEAGAGRQGHSSGGGSRRYMFYESKNGTTGAHRGPIGGA